METVTGLLFLKECSSDCMQRLSDDLRGLNNSVFRKNERQEVVSKHKEFANFSSAIVSELPADNTH